MKKVSKKKKLSALLLLICLGIFGAHRLYVGKIPTAVIMLFLSLSIIGLLFTTIWWWIDLLLILTNKFDDDEGNFLMEW